MFIFSACSHSVWSKPAKTGDFAAVRELLTQEDLNSRQQAEELALAVLSYEIAHSEVNHSSGVDDTAFIASLAACPGSTRSLLHKKSKGEDNLAAEASVILIENGYYSRSKAASFRGETDGAWRALAASVSDNADAQMRKAYLNDPDTRVRQGAARAALKAPKKVDASLLLEVARLDPDALVRSLAIQALARLDETRTTDALVDLYPVAAPADQLQIIQALSSGQHFFQGGQKRLEIIVAKETNLNGVYAARALIGAIDRRELAVNQRAPRSDELEILAISKQLATQRILQFAASGSSTEARAALRFLPMKDHDCQVRLRVAAKNSDTTIAVIALARLAGLTGAPKEIRQALFEIAQSDGPASLQALGTLAALGEPSIRARVHELAQSSTAGSRRIAGQALIRLGDYEALSPLLVDKNSAVRRHLACRLLASPR